MAAASAGAAGEIHLHYLNHPDVEALALSDAEIVAAVEQGSRRAGPRRDDDRAAHAPDARAGRLGSLQRPARLHPAARAWRASRWSATSIATTRSACRPSWRCSTCSIRRPACRSPSSTRADITDMRTGAVTAIGARELARRDSKVLGHIGARGTAYWNVRLLDSIFDVRRDPRPFAPARKAATRSPRACVPNCPARHVVVSEDWESCVRGADIVVEASRLEKPEPMLKTEWIEKGACVIPYGTMSAVELSLTDIMDKIVMDDWGQAKAGPFGALRAHVDSGRLSEKNLHAELGQIVAGRQARPRERRRDEPVLAPRPVALRHRPRRGDARQGEAPWASASACAFADERSRRMPVVNARMYSVTPSAKADWQRVLGWALRARRNSTGRSSTTTRRRRLRSSGRATTSAPR